MKGNSLLDLTSDTITLLDANIIGIHSFSILIKKICTASEVKITTFPVLPQKQLRFFMQT